MATAKGSKGPNDMKKYVIVGVIVAMLLIALAGKKGFKKRARGSKKKLQCQERFNGTTICNYDDHPKARVIVVTPNHKDVIVSLHNNFRSQVEPSAANMQKMVWDEKLAKFAQKWARVCKYGHDKRHERIHPDYQEIPMGQNVAYGYRDWPAVINLWYSEKQHIPGGRHMNDERVWTQQTGDRISRIGCGVAYCPQFRRCYVCNYAYGDDGKNLTPYKKGDPCSDCPGTCTDNLCDCKGKVCLNGGTLNVLNCKCKCPRVYGGSKCGKLKCPKRDKRRCGKNKPDSYPKHQCKKDMKVRMECPYMCGLCQREKKAKKEKVDKSGKPKKAKAKKAKSMGGKKPKTVNGKKPKKDASKKPKIPKKVKTPTKQDTPKKQDSPKKPEAAKKPEAFKKPEAVKKPETSKKQDTSQTPKSEPKKEKASTL